MKISYFFCIILILSVVNLWSVGTRWFKDVFLMVNILVFLSTLLFWVLYNKLTVGLQFVSSVTIPLGSIDWVVNFGLTGFSMFFVILTSFLICICIFISYEKTYKCEEFNFLLWILQLILFVFFMTDDLIVFFMCFEMCLVPIFLIILTWGSSVRRVLASYYFFIYTGIGAVLMILGICLIIMECGTTSMAVLSMHNFNSTKQAIYFFFFFWGFAIKIPMFPFHLWLPMAHVEAPTEGSILLAGLLLKLGSYGFIKILVSWFPVGCIYFLPLVTAMAVTSIIIASCNAIVQADFKRLIAYTSISHMNFVVLGIFSHSIFGLVGSAVLMYAHGLVSSGLFAVVGMLYERYFSRQMEYYSGLIVGMPMLGSFFFLILLGNFGFPLTFNFVGELLILIGLAHFNFYILFLSAIGLFLSVVYSVLLYNKLMFGNLKPFIRQIKDLTLMEFHCLFSISFYIIFFGIWPMSVLECIYLGLSQCLVK